MRRLKEMSDDRNDDFCRTMYFAESDSDGSRGAGFPYEKIFLIGGICVLVLALLMGMFHFRWWRFI